MKYLNAIATPLAHFGGSYAAMALVFHVDYTAALSTAFLVGATSFFEKSHAERTARETARLLIEHVHHHKEGDHSL